MITNLTKRSTLLRFTTSLKIPIPNNTTASPAPSAPPTCKTQILSSIHQITPTSTTRNNFCRSNTPKDNQTQDNSRLKPSSLVSPPRTPHTIDQPTKKEETFRKNRKTPYLESVPRGQRREEESAGIGGGDRWWQVGSASAARRSAAKALPFLAGFGRRGRKENKGNIFLSFSFS